MSDLEELGDILRSRPNLEVYANFRRVRAVYKFPWFPAYKGRVSLEICASTLSGTYDLVSHAWPCYPALSNLEMQRELDWTRALDIALSWVRLWEDVLVPPSQPTFGMSLKGITLKDSLLGHVKGLISARAGKDERIMEWQEYGHESGTLAQSFTPEELSVLLDIHVAVQTREYEDGTCHRVWKFWW